MSAPDHSDRAAWIQGPSAKCANLPAPNPHPWRLILLGAPGVGKGTQATLLSRHLGACHLSTGDVFRAAAKLGFCESPALQVALESMRRGDLVSDSTVWDMVRERSHCMLHCNGFILDGFPRTLAQAQSLRNLMDKEEISITAVVNYELPAKQIVQRLSGRRTCEQCKSNFHVKDQPPKKEDVCNGCGGRLYQREDDRMESIAVRLKAYEENTAPLINFYHKRDLLIPVDAQGTPAEILARTMVHLQRIKLASERAS